MGITEIIKHELVDAYPVLWEKEGEYIAQFKFTVLILPSVTERLTASFPLPAVTSQYNVSDEIQACIALPLKRAKKKKPAAKKAPVAAAKPAAAPAATAAAPAATPAPAAGTPAPNQGS